MDKYIFFNKEDLSTESLSNKLADAESFIRYVYNDPLAKYYISLKYQLEHLSDELLKKDNLIDFNDETNKYERIWKVIEKTESLVRQIEQTQKKVLPDNKTTEEEYAGRYLELKALKKQKELELLNTSKNGKK